MKKICVVGTGYVGLVTGTCFADLGNEVVCLDVIEEKIRRLQAGDIPIYEPRLEALVKRNVKAGRLTFTTDYASAVAGARFLFIAVNTPTKPDSDAADMTHVEDAARTIATHLRNDAIIVNKSTMPVGSGTLVSDIVQKHLSDPSLAVAVVSNPEFLKEGHAVNDFLHPDRVVLGSDDQAAAQRVAELYLTLRAPIVITDLFTAEMIKYASNAFLATKISFINEISRICDQLGADVKEVAAGMGYDKRIGNQFLHAGLGYGGSCFPKDVKALAHMAKEADLHPQLLEAVMKINQDQRQVAVSKLEEEFGGAGSLRDKTVAVLGLAFKDNTDDMREAPSVDIINALLDRGVQVRAFDPVAKESARKQYPTWDIVYCKDEYEAAQGSDGIILVTEWKRFQELDLEKLCGVMHAGEKAPVFIDGRNFFDPERVEQCGFRYHGIGRGTARRRNGKNGHSNGNGDNSNHQEAAVIATIANGNGAIAPSAAASATIITHGE